MRNPLLSALKAVQRLFGGSGLGRVKPVRKAYDEAYRLLKPGDVEVQGHRMRLDEKDTLELATREVYEPVETGLLLKELKEGGIFIDVGANIGYYTLLAARVVGSSGHVYAFEPEPSHFGLLQDNVSLNGYANVTLTQMAVSNRARTAKLYLNETNLGDHRIYDPGDRRRSIPIKTVALDGFFKKLDKKIDFIKMDVQGAEAHALDGMIGLIRSNRGIKLVTEYCGGNLRKFGRDPELFLSDLRKLGFKIHEISETTGTVKVVPNSYLLNRYGGDTDDYTNLYCLRK